MADTDPTSVGVGDYNPAILEATTSPSTVTLDGNKQYQLIHNGIGEDGVAHTGYIMLGFNGATAEVTSGVDKAILSSGIIMTIGPGITTLKLDASADDPTVSVVPISNDFGNH